LWQFIKIETVKGEIMKLIVKYFLMIGIAIAILYYRESVMDAFDLREFTVFVLGVMAEIFLFFWNPYPRLNKW
jgi:hypothetical protein